MKLKLFTIGLLATLVMANQAEAMMKRTYEAPKIESELQEHKNVQSKIAPKLDVATHGDIEHAAQDINDSIGKHPHAPARTGTTVNHKIADVNARLGKKAAGSAGDSTHHRVTDIMSVQGAVTNAAAAPGAKTGNIGAAPGDLAGTAIKNEEAILARLKAWANANDVAIKAGRAIQAEFVANTTSTPGTAPGAGTWLVVGDWTAAAAAGDIETFLAALGM